jgi:Tfp pilus assembly protein PilO
MKLGVREILVLMMTLAVLTAGHVLVFVPASMERGDLRADIRIKQRALADLAAATLSAKELDRRADQTRHEILHFTRTLPPEQSAARIVDDFTQAADHNRLSIERIEPLELQRLPIYSQRPVRIRLSGDCAGVYLFLQEMETGAQPARVTQMSLHKTAQDGEVTADLTIVVYFAPTNQTVSIHQGENGE